MRVGFIGLGMMGKGMAANLQKAGHELVVHDLSRAAAEPFLAKGAVWANSPKQVAEQTEVVFTSLPVPADVEQVALGAERADRGHAPRHRLLRHVDQFGGDGAQDPRRLRREEPLHAQFAGQRRPLRRGQRQDGDLGRRRRADLQPPQDRCSTRWATRRPISARSAPARSPSSCTTAPARCWGWRSPRSSRWAIKAGVDPVDLWAAVRQGATGRVRTFDRLGDKFLPGQHDPADFALRLLHKDVGLAVGLGREVGVPMRLANLAYEELTEAMNRGWGTRNSTVGQLLQVERAGIEPLAADPRAHRRGTRRRQAEVGQVKRAQCVGYAPLRSARPDRD